MFHEHHSDFINPSNLTLPPPNDAASQATYRTAEQDALRVPTNNTRSEFTPDDDNKLPPTPLTNDDRVINPHQIATKRAKAAKARLATAHEGWTLAAQALAKTGIVPPGGAISRDMKEFGDAICGRYAAAAFLWNVLANMPETDWFGRKGKFDATLRRLNTLKGLEASLVVWERLVLELMDLVDGKREGEVGCEEVGRVLGRWRMGMPRRP